MLGPIADGGAVVALVRGASHHRHPLDDIHFRTAYDR
jgi:hypothetical protein